MKKIVFYYPSYITGGAEYLLKTTAELLSKKYSILIADIHSGWLSSNVSSGEILLLEKGKKIYLDENHLLITTANLTRNLDLFFEGDFKVLSWVVQIYNVIPALPRVGGWQHKKNVRNILKKTILKKEYEYFKNQVSYLNENNSIFVMDDGCKDVIDSYLSVDLNNYLPVAIPDQKFISPSKVRNEVLDDVVRVVWLGRLDGEFKNPILIRVIKDLIEYSRMSSQKIIFDIVGDGPGEDEIRLAAKNDEKIEFIFHGMKRHEELVDIIQNTNVGFSMGTSALEIAAQNKPTVLLDCSYNPVGEKYRYKWLYEEKNYSIGRLIEFSDDPSMGNKYTLSNIMEKVRSSSSEYATKCFQHVKNNHSLQSLEEKLLNAISTNTFSFSEAKERGVFKKPFWFPLKKW